MLVHDQAIRTLDPTDYLLIEKEHALLKKFLSDLHDACCNLDTLLDCQQCDKEKIASCQGRLPSFLFYVIDLAARHFDHEETIMLSRPHVTKECDYFRMHHQAHAEIMQQLHALGDECFSLGNQDNTATIYRRFHKTLSDLFEAHDRAFDDPFIQSTQTLSA